MAIAEQILTATNGKEGIEIIKKYCLNEHAATVECPDLILLDLHMPIMTGFEVAEELQTIMQSNLIQAKIVILSSSSNPRDMEKMASFGVKQYLEKPIREDEILALSEVIARENHVRNPKINAV
jgi:CheY-like chemotaxis protein